MGEDILADPCAFHAEGPPARIEPAVPPCRRLRTPGTLTLRPAVV